MIGAQREPARPGDDLVAIRSLGCVEPGQKRTGAIELAARPKARVRPHAVVWRAAEHGARDPERSERTLLGDRPGQDAEADAHRDAEPLLDLLADALAELLAWHKRTGGGHVADAFWSAWEAFAGADSYESAVRHAFMYPMRPWQRQLDNRAPIESSARESSLLNLTSAITILVSSGA